jgi:hypothetical protein
MRTGLLSRRGTEVLPDGVLLAKEPFGKGFVDDSDRPGRGALHDFRSRLLSAA